MAEKLTLEKMAALGKIPERKVQLISESSIHYDDFKGDPFCATPGGGAATGSDEDENLCITDYASYRYHLINAQAIHAFTMETNGMKIDLDQTDDDGVEIVPFGINSYSRTAFTVGSTDSFYTRCRLKISDVSGTDTLLFGFRKAEAFQKVVANYDELAALNLVSGDIKISTILNGAGSLTTSDTTDNVADDAVIDLYVQVSDAGVVTFKHGLNKTLSAPTSTQEFTFDDDEVVIPFLHVLHDSDLISGLYLKSWETGYVSEA